MKIRIGHDERQILEDLMLKRIAELGKLMEKRDSYYDYYFNNRDLCLHILGEILEKEK
jgi:hypothetical protein